MIGKNILLIISIILSLGFLVGLIFLLDFLLNLRNAEHPSSNNERTPKAGYYHNDVNVTPLLFDV